MRHLIKSVTGTNLWLRYAFLAPWRLLYAAQAGVTGRNIAGHFEDSEEWLDQYAQTVFDNYKEWSGLERFYGRVAELGPGDVSGVAHRFLADGCTQVDQIEPYRHPQNSDPRVVRHVAVAEDFFAAHRGYDFIVSCAVLEHVRDPLLVLQRMAAALNPGGMMLHAVDCRDHGQFSDRLHDLTFLRIPRTLYWPLTLASGLNRVRLSAYLELLRSLGLRHRVLVTSLSGIADQIASAKEFKCLDPELLEQSRRNLAAIRSKLANPFKAMADEDLMISGFALVAQCN